MPTFVPLVDKVQPTRNPNMNNFEIKFIECFLKAVHKICDDILKEQINLMLATIFVQLLSHLYWFRSLSSEHIRSTFGALAMADWKKERAG